MSQVYLHIGMPKTGTSALQKFLLTNKEVLEKGGYFYPGHSFDRNNISSGNGEQLVYIAKNEGIDAAKNYLNTIRDESAGLNLLLSSEFFFNSPKLIKQIIPDAVIIVYFRNPLTLLESSYNQSVKRLGQTHPFYRALMRTYSSEDPFYTGKKLLEWVDLYGREKLIFRVYETTQFSGRNIYDDFTSLLGLENYLELVKPEEKVNVSYSLDAVNFKRCLNSVLEHPDTLYHKVIDQELQSYSHDYFMSGGSQYSLYTKSELEAAQRFFVPFNKRVSDALGIEGPLFKETYSLSLDERTYETRISVMGSIAKALFAREPKLRDVLRRAISSAYFSDVWSKREAAMRLFPVIFDSKGYASLLSEGERAFKANSDSSWFNRSQLIEMSQGKYVTDDYRKGVANLARERKEFELAERLAPSLSPPVSGSDAGQGSESNRTQPECIELNAAWDELGWRYRMLARLQSLQNTQFGGLAQKYIPVKALRAVKRILEQGRYR